ncbi:MAG: hypothetical protein PGN24_04545 [Microbacterium arborescens]
MTVRLTCSAAGCGWRTDARRRGLETARAAATEHAEIAHAPGPDDAADVAVSVIRERRRFRWLFPLTVVNIAALLVAVFATLPGMPGLALYLFPQIGLWGLPFGASLGTGCILVVLATAGALAAGGADRRDVLYRAWAGATAAGLGVFVLCAAITTAVFSVLAWAVS